MPKEADNQPKSQHRDVEVPEFGGYSPEELQVSQERRALPDVRGDEAVSGLYASAVHRTLYFSYGIGEVPHVHFPNGEHFQHVPFTHDHWERYRNMECEFSRVAFMLSQYQSRWFPEAFNPICTAILNSDDVLQAWSNHAPQIESVSADIYEQTAVLMDAQKVHDNTKFTNGAEGAYQSAPVSYKVPKQEEWMERVLWEKAISQVAKELQRGEQTHVPAFLHFYNRLKDPITPIRSTLPVQVKVFQDLYDRVQSFLQSPVEHLRARYYAVAQLALESSFLALPAIQTVARVSYGGHHELPYVYVDVKRLPRGEFADPQSTVDVVFGEKVKKNIDGIIEDAKRHSEGRAAMTPITVSYAQAPHQSNPELFIVDGNNRGTAVLLMQFLNFVHFDATQVASFRESLRRFVLLHDLDIEWERDLTVLLQHLGREQILTLLSEKAIVQQFADALVPALLVQEPNFHTIDVKQSTEKKPEIFLLSPFHQAIYNDRRRPMAIPAKQQSHGRAAGNDRRLPLHYE